MDRWYTSDTHFGHKNLVAKGHRGFPSLPEMHECLIAGWNERVRPNDEIWILGDFALRPFEESLTVGQALQGRKILVPGNHDGCWIPKLERYNPWKVLGIQSLYTHLANIRDIVDQPSSHNIAGEDVALSHFPYTADHTSVPRYMEHRPPDNGGWLLHGHVHDLWMQHDKQINVGVDAWCWRPVHVDEIAALIAEGPADRAPMPV